MIITAKGTEQVDHPAKECPTLWGNLAGVTQVTD